MRVRSVDRQRIIWNNKLRYQFVYDMKGGKYIQVKGKWERVTFRFSGGSWYPYTG